MGNDKDGEAVAGQVPTLRLALAQEEPILRDVDAALARIGALAGDAAAAGADLLILPEMFLTGYAIGADDVARLAQPTAGRTAGQPNAAELVGATARTHGLAVVYGFPERCADGRVRNSASFVGEDGRVLATYRKLHRYGDVDATQFAAGSEPPPVVRWRGWGIGLGICYDVEFPEFVRMSALAGADLVCVPTANMSGFERVSRVLVPARAYENQLYVAYANYVGADDSFTYNGTSVVAGPDGGLLVEGSGSDAALLYADVHTSAVAEARAGGSYLADRRPDVYGPADAG